MERFGENLRLWCRHLTFVKILKLSVLSMVIVSVFPGGYAVYAPLHPEKRFHRLIDACDELIKEEKYDRAVIDMSNALKIKPDYVKGLYFLASVHMLQNSVDKTEAALYRIMDLEPDCRDSVQKLESILIEKRDAGALQDLAGRILEKMPVESRIMLARLPDIYHDRKKLPIQPGSCLL